MCRFTLLVGAGFASVLAMAAALRPAIAADKLIIVVGGIEKQIYLPAKLTESLGYFRDEGLDVELQSDQSGVDAEDELLAGAVQGVVGFYDHCIDLQSKGKFVVSIVQFAQAPGEVELVSSRHPEIATPADFRGTTLGVTGLGSSTNFLTQFLAVKHGLRLGEFTSMPVGAGDTFIAAMQQDLIQAGMTTEPTVSRLLATGDAKILVDMRTAAGSRAMLGGAYPGSTFYMETQWVEQHRDIAQKLVNAFVRTLRFIATHSADEIADRMPQEYYAGDKAAYVKALAGGKAMFTPDGVMPTDGPETVYAVLSSFSKTVQGKKIDLSKTYTTEFVRAVN